MDTKRACGLLDSLAIAHEREGDAYAMELAQALRMGAEALEQINLINFNLYALGELAKGVGKDGEMPIMRSGN